jgi:hypothetical protein
VCIFQISNTFIKLQTGIHTPPNVANTLAQFRICRHPFQTQGSCSSKRFGLVKLHILQCTEASKLGRQLYYLSVLSTWPLTATCISTCLPLLLLASVILLQIVYALMFSEMPNRRHGFFAQTCRTLCMHSRSCLVRSVGHACTEYSLDLEGGSPRAFTDLPMQ